MENSNLAIPREATILVNEIQQVPVLRKKNTTKKKGFDLYWVFVNRSTLGARNIKRDTYHHIGSRLLH